MQTPAREFTPYHNFFGFLSPRPEITSPARHIALAQLYHACLCRDDAPEDISGLGVGNFARSEQELRRPVRILQTNTGKSSTPDPSPPVCAVSYMRRLVLGGRAACRSALAGTAGTAGYKATKCVAHACRYNCCFFRMSSSMMLTDRPRLPIFATGLFFSCSRILELFRSMCASFMPTHAHVLLHAFMLTLHIYALEGYEAHALPRLAISTTSLSMHLKQEMCIDLLNLHGVLCVPVSRVCRPGR